MTAPNHLNGVQRSVAHCDDARGLVSVDDDGIAMALTFVDRVDRDGVHRPDGGYILFHSAHSLSISVFNMFIIESSSVLNVLMTCSMNINRVRRFVEIEHRPVLQHILRGMVRLDLLLFSFHFALCLSLSDSSTA